MKGSRFPTVHDDVAAALAPQRCWFIGDHPVNDIAGSRAAGMRPVWLAGFHATSDEVGSAPIIASLAELESLIGAFTNA